MIEATDKNGFPGGKREAEPAAFNPLDKNTPTIAALAIAAVGILIMPMSHLLSTRPHLQFSIFWKTEPPLSTAASVVLAVDALGLKIQTKNADAGAQERFENVALQHLARLHRIYSTWAKEKQDLMGSLHLKLKVDASGTVVSIDPLATQLTNVNFIHAVIAEVRNWKFPGGVTESAEITVPLLFVQRGMDPNTAVQWDRNIRRADGSGKAVTGLRVASNSTMAAFDASASKSVPSTAASHRTETIQASPVRLPKTKTENDASVAFKTTQSVTLREQPRFSSKRVHELDGETLLTLLENKGDWLKVKLADAGAIGFLRKEFVSPTN
jgi:hypothetical protein